MTYTSHWTPDAIADQSGRTALITGANSGIGLQTVRGLARRGARVILAGRSLAKLEEAAALIEAETPDVNLSTLVLDLGDLASIRDAAGQIARTETVDLLINNAGVMNIPERRTTKDGFEMTVGTNHLGHFAFTAQVFPSLQRSAASRIVTVSAIAATWRSGELTDLMSEQRYRPMSAYAKSKRANVVFTRELARRLAGTSSKAVVIHPGSAITNLQRHTQGVVARSLTGLMERFVMGSPEGAAWPSLYAATSPEVRSGQFIGPAARRQDAGTPKPVPLPRGAADPAEGMQLWNESERLTKVRFTIG
ncbi:oxidoreductase [Rhodococcus sp. NPDC057529]|uniref:oxidoreductase n=1 Tax=Rhodococcus sp. NPDC057529 TaxID=3346158 RepID=UPI00366BCF6D